MAEVGAVSAAVLYGAAIVLLLAVRSWQQHRTTGTAGFNGFRGAKVPAARVAGIGFVTALLAGALSPILVSLHLLPPLWPGSRWAAGLTVGGAALALAGVVLAVAAQAAMGISWRIGVDASERTDLVTHGPFALIRNPIFTALLIIQLGTAVMAPTWVAVVGAGALVLGLQLQVRLVEEPYLLTSHEISYPSYAARAGRFVPVVGRLRHGGKNPEGRTS